MTGFPRVRQRRLRRTPLLRAAVAESVVRPASLVQPLFVAGTGVPAGPIASMPGQSRLTPDAAAEAAAKAAAAGVGGVILFGVPEHKDADATGAHDPEGPVCTAIRAIKSSGAPVSVWADVCLCEYTDHGHCGLVDAATGEVLNDASLDHLAAAAVAYAAAGADIVAPSDMMDGRIGAVRTALDGAGHSEVVVVSYAAKYASAFYGPFREAAESTPAFGDRRTYQMDPPNVVEALREVDLDVDEGADIVMVKPAGPYLDVVRAGADHVDVPVAAYQVSGEYAMVEAAAANGWIDRDRAIAESLVGIRRAGASIVLTYWAREFAERLA